MTEPEIIMQPGRLPSKGRADRSQLSDRYAHELDRVAADLGQWYELIRYAVAADPGQWYELIRYAAGTSAYSGAQALRRALPDYDYEVVSRGRSVWVRYVGHGEEVED